jgi:hemerythrin-like domain-containing protein
MGLKAGRRRKDRSDPFAMLERSHERLRENLSYLLEAASALNTNPGDFAARDQVVEVAAFIDRAVTRHELDEEQSLFPLLRGHREVADLIGRLEVEHRAHEKLHEQLHEIAAHAADAALDAAGVSELSDLAVTLSQVYTQHIEAEELDLFPAARTLLTAAQATAVADEMQARRGR